ncbi:MAG: hypothetical protein ACE14Q_01305 [Acidobacteriota bacterium]
MIIEEIAENALKIISEQSGLKEQKEDTINLNELKEVLSKGGRIILSKKNMDPKLERNALELISSLSRIGIDVNWDKSYETEKKETSKVSTSPDKEVLEEILSDVIEKETPCIIEPGKICVNCSGRCKTLGF